MNTVSFPKFGWSFDINSRAFSLFGIDIYWYGIIIAVGVALAVIYGLKKAKQVGLDPDRVIDVAIGGFIGGIVGARLYYVIFSWDAFKGDPMKIFDIREGGLAIYGGLIGGIAVGLLMCKLRKVKINPMLDLAGLGFLIGQGIGRWGNFVNVEAYGSPTTLPWGMASDKITAELSGRFAVPADGVLMVHPTFLYESLWCLLGFLLLHLYFKHRKYDGQIFMLYALWYGTERVFVEGLRTDSLQLGPFRVSQLLSALVIITAIAAMAIVAVLRKTNEIPLYVNTDESRELLAMKDKKENDKEEYEPILDESDEFADEQTEDEDTQDITENEVDDNGEDN